MASTSLIFSRSLLLLCFSTIYVFPEIVSATAPITPAPSLNNRVVQDRAIIDSYCAWWTAGTTSMLPFPNHSADLTNMIAAWHWTCGFGTPCVIATYLPPQIVFCSTSSATPDTSLYG
jgi:hypothetical protein